MHAFWLVLTYDLLEDRCIDDIIIKTFSNSLLYKQKSGTQGTAECVTDVLTTLWRPLRSITEQMHGNLESIC